MFTPINGWSDFDNGGTLASRPWLEPFNYVFNPTTRRVEFVTKNYWFSATPGAFSRAMGSTAPQEDWATTWESLFVADIFTDTTGQSVILPRQAAVVDFFLDNIR